MVLTDSANQSSILGDYGYYDELKDSAFVTGNALAMEYSGKDTLYLAQKIAGQLNTSLVDFEVLEQCADKQDTDTVSTLYPSGDKVVEKPEILFARQDIKEVMEQVEEMFAQRKEAAGDEGDRKSVV